MGIIMRELGYATAYFGKFELNRELIFASDTVNYTRSLRKYGFDVFPADGDKTGSPNQGYDTDEYTVSASNRWLRTHAQRLNREGKPWLVVVSMVNPHDIMYTNANIPFVLGRQDKERLTTRRASEPRKVELAQCKPACERFQKRVEDDPMGAGPTLAFEERTALVNNCC